MERKSTEEILEDAIENLYLTKNAVEISTPNCRPRSIAMTKIEESILWLREMLRIENGN